MGPASMDDGFQDLPEKYLKLLARTNSIVHFNQFAEEGARMSSFSKKMTCAGCKLPLNSIRQFTVNKDEMQPLCMPCSPFKDLFQDQDRALVSPT
jgi:hypothetical protein